LAGNLTRDEARERARLLKVESYEVALDLTEGDERFESVTTVRFTSTNPGASTFIDLHGANVRKVTLNGAALDVAAYDPDTGRFPLTSLADSNELVVDADCSYMRTGEGLHRFVDPVDQKVYLHSQFETADAHRMYACFDQPDLKATFQLTVLAPAEWEIISNATALTVDDLDGQTGRHGGIQAANRWEFAVTPAISTYITALVAGPYYKVTSEHDGIRSAFTAGPPSASTSTPTTSSRSPGRASTSSTRCSASATRSASTTSSSCPSSTPGRWRTRAA
jgi:aminopeptidase N